MKIKAKVHFDLKDVEHELKTELLDQLDLLQDGAARSISVHGTPVFGERKYVTLEQGQVHRMYFWMDRLHEDIPFWLRGKPHSVRTDIVEFGADLGVNLRVADGWSGGEMDLSANDWNKARLALMFIDNLTSLRPCEVCGRPLVDSTGLPMADPRVTQCSWACQPLEQLAFNDLNKLLEPAS